MTTGLSQVILVLLPVLVGAAVGAVPAIAIERSRVRTTLDTRWDTALHQTCAQFAVTARTLIDIAEELPEADARRRQEAVATMARERGRLHVLLAEIRLLADARVQLAARQVVRHTWAVQKVAIGAGPAGDGAAPRERALAGMFEFYRAVRLQLRVPEADELAPLNPPTERRQ
ncbi:hypothetical protein [Actinoplanes sp. NPDC048796]|uniref:hypothetical protein n=1 Tax=Actinoplanes sp. NPDC048796 TaxID=3155640 RepID=UPI0033CF0EE7